jgi:glycosyltransferase involved in cell wall biosynthesis
MHSGGKLKSAKLLFSLAERYHVTLLCPLKGNDAGHLNDFCRISPCIAHYHEGVETPRTLLNLAKSYAKGIPINVLRSYSPQLCDQLDDMVDEYDFIFLDHFELFSYIPKRAYDRTIYHAHNAYHQIWRSFSRTKAAVHLRVASWLEYHRVRRYEKRVCNESKLIFAAPDDGKLLSNLGVSPQKIHETYHLGDSWNADLPELDYESTAKKLMYVGFLGWEPNRAGILWFISSVWPTLKRAEPELVLNIIGKGADDTIKQAVTNNPGIILRGFVDDLEPEYQSSRVSIAPLQFGSGMKVKVLDSMARGLPTVTTATGAESIDFEQGKHLFVSSGADDMAHNIISLLNDQSIWSRLNFYSRQLISQRYNWKSMLANMHSTIAQLGLCKPEKPAKDKQRYFFQSVAGRS